MRNAWSNWIAHQKLFWRLYGIPKKWVARLKIVWVVYHTSFPPRQKLLFRSEKLSCTIKFSDVHTSCILSAKKFCFFCKKGCSVILIIGTPLQENGERERERNYTPNARNNFRTASLYVARDLPKLIDVLRAYFPPTLLSAWRRPSKKFEGAPV